MIKNTALVLAALGLLLILAAAAGRTIGNPAIVYGLKTGAVLAYGNTLVLLGVALKVLLDSK